MFLVATTEGNCSRAVSRREELALISDVRHQRILSPINPRSPASLDSYNLKCDTENMVEVENVYQSVVNAIGWTNMYDENLRKTDEKELEIIKSVRIGKIEREKQEKREREEMKQTRAKFKLGKFIGKVVAMV